MVTRAISSSAQQAFTLREWWNAKSEWFSDVCGEEFTNKEVVLTHFGVLALIAACGVAEWLEGGAV